MDKEESFWDTIKTVFYAILIAIVIRTIWFEPFKIPSGSMYPTLYVGDYLFVSKYTYGYSKHSLPWSLPLFEGRIWEDEPERGDVVVFKYPQDNKTDFIKRVIGLPGSNWSAVVFLLTERWSNASRSRTLPFAMLTAAPSGIVSILRRCPTAKSIVFWNCPTMRLMTILRKLWFLREIIL